MKGCKNPTCDRPAGRQTYCSRECQVAMRNVSCGRSLPDVWVSMATYHRLVEYAATLGVTVRDVVANAIEDVVDPWD